MAGTALKIDDDYVLDMGTTLSDNETELQSGVDKYLEIMKKSGKMPLRKGKPHRHWIHLLLMLGN